MLETDVLDKPLRIASTPPVFAARQHSSIAVVLGGLAVVMYGVSFYLPAVDQFVGYQTFIYAVLFVIAIPMWLANPVFWLGLARLVQGDYRSAGKAGLLAVVLALSESWMFSGGLRVGYFLWMGSMAVLAVAGLCSPVPENRPRHWPVLPRWRIGGEGARIVARFRR